MTQNLLTLALLVVCWMAWSGHYTAPDHPLIIAFMALSIAATMFFARRMDIFDEESHPLYLAPPRMLGYLPWLLKEIVASNIDVTRRVLSPKPQISPTLIRVRSTQQSAIGQVIFANSITLTPGTVSIEVHRGEILVHALSKEGADSLMEGEMDRRVTAVEHIG